MEFKAKKTISIVHIVYEEKEKTKPYFRHYIQKVKNFFITQYKPHAHNYF